ncbi:hypothetical protein [Desulfocicer niacini]
MNQFELIQYGYLGLLALLILMGGQSVNTYLKSSNPPRFSVLIISIYLLLVVLGGVFGYLWADKELQSSEAKKTTASIVQTEISIARDRLSKSLQPLYIARDKALEMSVYGGNSDAIQEKHSVSAKLITEMIEMQEARYERELENITEAFVSIDQAATK